MNVLTVKRNRPLKTIKPVHPTLRFSCILFLIFITNSTVSLFPIRANFSAIQHSYLQIISSPLGYAPLSFRSMAHLHVLTGSTCMICVGKGDTSAHQSRTINPTHGVGEWIETRLCLITATKILTSPSPHCWLWLSKDQFRVHSHQRPLRTLHGIIVVLSLKESEAKDKGGESIRKLMFSCLT